MGSNRGFLVLVALAAAVSIIVWRVAQLPPKAPAELTEKRLTFNSADTPVNSFALSPDGKYLAYADLAGIHMKLLSTGEERLIPKPKGVSASDSWDVGSWFPDGTSLLANVTSLLPGGPASIWTVSMLGQSPRELRESALGWEVSPDGTKIAFSPSKTPNQGFREIWVSDSQGGNAQNVISLGAQEWIGAVHWSPDGRRLAYKRDDASSADTWKTWIESCDLNGANCAVAVPGDAGHWYSDFCWLTSGRVFYAREASTNSGEYSLWERDVDSRTGKPADEPKRITHWSESDAPGLNASADGKHLAVLRQMTQGQIEIGPLSAAGRSMGVPRRLTNDEAFGYPSAWTADSKSVLLTYNHGGQWSIFKQAIDEQAAEPIATGPLNAMLPCLSPDGAWIIYATQPRAAPHSVRLMRVPVNGGVPEFVLDTRNWTEHQCGRAPAGCIVIERSEDRKWRTVTAFDPFKGRGKLLRTLPEDDPNEIPADDLSSDGSTYAVARKSPGDTHIQLFSLSHRPDREIVVRGWTNFVGMDWSPDGKGLYCGSVSRGNRNLLYVDLKGTARLLRQYRGVGGRLIWGVPSPDGRYIAILGGTLSANVWMVEGF